MPILKTILSNQEPQTKEVTQLDVLQDDTLQDDMKLTMSIKLITGTNVHYDILAAKLNKLFTIRFSQYDLNKNMMTGGYVEYSSNQVKPVIADFSGGIALTYSCPPHPTNVGGNFGPMQVTVYIVPPILQGNSGWINFDIKHDYPAGINSDDTASAWEENITFPVLNFDYTVLTNYRSLPAYGARLPLSFGSLYKLDQFGDGTNYAQGWKLLTIIFVMLKKELDYWYLGDRLYNRKLRALDAAA